MRKAKKRLALLLAFVLTFGALAGLPAFTALGDTADPYVYAGVKSLKAVYHSSAAWSCLVYQTAAVEKNTDYTFSVWAKASTREDSRGVFTIDVNPGGDYWAWPIVTGHNSYFDGPMPSTDTWTQYSTSFNSGDNASVDVRFRFDGKYDIIYFDNASLAKDSDGVNVLVNPGFEDGWTGWTDRYGSSSIFVSTILDSILPTGITVTGAGGATAITAVRGTLQMSASFTPSDTTDKRVTWSVDDTSLASISSSGLLSAKNNGQVTVTATSVAAPGVSGSAVISLSGQDGSILIPWQELPDKGGWTDHPYWQPTYGPPPLYGQNGAELTYRFNGTGIELFTADAWTNGLLDIYIDGVYKTSIYSSSHNLSAPGYSIKTLAPGDHTIRLVANGAATLWWFIVYGGTGTVIIPPILLDSVSVRSAGGRTQTAQQP